MWYLTAVACLVLAVVIGEDPATTILFVVGLYMLIHPTTVDQIRRQQVLRPLTPDDREKVREIGGRISELNRQIKEKELAALRESGPIEYRTETVIAELRERRSELEAKLDRLLHGESQES